MDKFDASWWIALVIPFFVSTFVFLTTRLYQSTLSAISLSYHIREQQDPDLTALTRSVVTVWNDGTEVIEADTFATLAPLQITAETDFNLVNAEIQRVSLPASNVRLADANDQRQQINIEFLNPGEGFRWVGHHDAGTGCISVKAIMKGSKHNVRRYRIFISTQTKICAVIVLIGGVWETISTMIGIATHIGLSSWWFWTYLPAPILLITSAMFMISGLLAMRRDKGVRLVAKWDALEQGRGPVT